MINQATPNPNERSQNMQNPSNNTNDSPSRLSKQSSPLGLLGCFFRKKEIETSPNQDPKKLKEYIKTSKKLQGEINKFMQEMVDDCIKEVKIYFSKKNHLDFIKSLPSEHSSNSNLRDFKSINELDDELDNYNRTKTTPSKERYDEVISQLAKCKDFKSHYGTILNEIADYIKKNPESLKIKFHSDRNTSGQTNTQNVITIGYDHLNSSSQKLLFTIGHEIGHILLRKSQTYLKITPSIEILNDIAEKYEQNNSLSSQRVGSYEYGHEEKKEELIADLIGLQIANKILGQQNISQKETQNLFTTTQTLLNFLKEKFPNESKDKLKEKLKHYQLMSPDIYSSEHPSDDIRNIIYKKYGDNLLEKSSKYEKKFNQLKEILCQYNNEKQTIFNVLSSLEGTDTLSDELVTILNEDESLFKKKEIKDKLKECVKISKPSKKIKSLIFKLYTPDELVDQLNEKIETFLLKKN